MTTQLLRSSNFFTLINTKTSGNEIHDANWPAGCRSRLTTASVGVSPGCPRHPRQYLTGFLQYGTLSCRFMEPAASQNFDVAGVLPHLVRSVCVARLAKLALWLVARMQTKTHTHTSLFLGGVAWVWRHLDVNTNMSKACYRETPSLFSFSQRTFQFCKSYQICHVTHV